MCGEIILQKRRRWSRRNLQLSSIPLLQRIRGTLVPHSLSPFVRSAHVLASAIEGHRLWCLPLQKTGREKTKIRLEQRMPQ